MSAALLKRPWWPRYADLERVGVGWLHYTAQASFFACARTFIARHAEEAEAHGWQPAHLLSRRGLASSWHAVYSDNGRPIAFCPGDIRWGDRSMIYASPNPDSNLMMGRVAKRDGSVGILTGEALTLMCGRHAAFCQAQDCWPQM